VVDYVMQRITAGTIFNLLPDDFEFSEHRHESRPTLVRSAKHTLQRS
jgi:hypothetical protein